LILVRDHAQAAPKPPKMLKLRKPPKMLKPPKMRKLRKLRKLLQTPKTP
jgi:hypothetical protein